MTVRGNEWHFVDLVEIDDRQPAPVVSVVIPAKDCQSNLDRLLASIAAQTYPADSIEVIVVDDASSPPLRVPDGVELVALDAAGGFGAGRARNAGAASASGSVLLFLDADLLLGHDAVARLVRWPISHPAAVVTGVLAFFDVSAVGEQAVERAIEDRGLGELLGPFESHDQGWRERHFERSFDMTVDDPDMFCVTIGAVMCVPREFHEAVGGLRELGMRGIEDTEYGYRLYTEGGLMVLDREVELWHQGRRFFDSARADEAKRDREALNDELMATPRYRVTRDRARRVPVALITSDAGVTIGGLSTSTRRDVLDLEGDHGDEAATSEVDRDASPFRIHVSRSCSLGAESLEKVLDCATSRAAGVVRLIDTDGTEILSVTSRRALGRAALLGLSGAAASDHMRDAFGEWWQPIADFDVTVS